jgi:hypothetical protein
MATKTQITSDATWTEPGWTKPGTTRGAIR